MKLSTVIRTASQSGNALQKASAAAKKAHAFCGKSTVGLFFDILRSASTYGAGPMDYLMSHFYELNAEERATYLTRIRSAEFVRKVNDPAYWPIFDDKNAFYPKFHDMMGRETYDLTKGDLEGFRAFMEGKEAIMAKPSDQDGGSGIEKLRPSDFESIDAMWAYLRNPAKPFHIADEALKQHPGMAALHPASVNCVRLSTYVMDDGEPVVVYAACKAGTGGGECDNTGRGGITCRLDIENGVITSNGHNEELEEFITHPDTGITFKGYHIPMAKECKELALTAAKRYPSFRYVGWDICVTPTGPVLIEGNNYPGYDLAQMPDNDDPHPRHGLITNFKKLGIEI
ncbi:MAG: hypothetical protein KBS74_01625 [Clostridiales bacterium]|nr:hypothetical protein [Candidatus Cacconaster stercorequi]